MEQQKNVERVAIHKKLQIAASMRDENIKKMLERLKEHVSIVNVIWAQSKQYAMLYEIKQNYVIFEMFCF